MATFRMGGMKQSELSRQVGGPVRKRKERLVSHFRVEGDKKRADPRGDPKQ